MREKHKGCVENKTIFSILAENKKQVKKAVKIRVELKTFGYKKE